MAEVKELKSHAFDFNLPWTNKSRYLGQTYALGFRSQRKYILFYSNFSYNLRFLSTTRFLMDGVSIPDPILSKTQKALQEIRTCLSNYSKSLSTL